MVVGDAINDIQVIGESEAAIFGPPPPGLEYEITNIYIPAGVMAVAIHIIDPNTSATAEVGTIDEPYLNANLHLNADQQLQVLNPSVDTIAVAIDGIVTRRPPTEFA